MTAPFGIELHQPLPSAVKGEDAGGKKFVVSPQSPHPAFAEYYAQESDRFGVVWIKAVSSVFANDAFGTSARASYEKLAEQLKSRYGNAKTTDILRLGSIWTEPRDWVAGVYESERIFFRLWDRDNGANLPDDISSIFLSIHAFSHNDCAVIIEYSSTKHADAESDNDDSFANLL